MTVTTKTTKTATQNGNGNGKNGKATSASSDNKTKQTADTNETVKTAKTSKTAAASQTDADPEEQAKELVKQIRSLCFKNFKVKIPTREQRLEKKVGHAIKDKLGRDIARLVAKNNGKMDWNLWNNKIFPTLLGSPDELKQPLDVIAIAMAKIYDNLSLDPNETMAELVEYNEQSFAARTQPKEETVEDEDEDIDLDEDEDLIDELSDEMDDDEDEEEDDDE